MYFFVALATDRHQAIIAVFPREFVKVIASVVNRSGWLSTTHTLEVSCSQYGQPSGLPSRVIEKSGIEPPFDFFSR